MQAKLQLEASYYHRFFEENYAFLKSLALRITNDSDTSDDLLHDFYLKVRKNEPENPQDIKAYLFIALKNSYTSVIRKRKLNEKVLSFDEESLSNTLFDEKIASRLLLEEKLRAVCKYACLRKETSISGSVVVLRYFHGYHVGEVSGIIRRSRNAVEARIVSARREIVQYLANPDAVQFPLAVIDSTTLITDRSEPAKDLLTDLRGQIYSNRRGVCLSGDEYERLYHIDRDAPTRKVLSHLVSCVRCLTKVNRVLNLPDLSTRHPLDYIRESLFGLLPVIFAWLESFI